MYFYLIGIDYKSLNIRQRDIIYQDRKAISGFWANYNPRGTAVLVTCNRIEIYGVAENADEAFGFISKFSKEFPDFTKSAYLKYTKSRVFSHALRLATGLESQLKGELQILAQLDTWRLNSKLPPALKELWDEVILLSQEIRFASKLNDERDNIATLLFDDVKRRLGEKERYEVIVIGTGKIAELFVKFKPLEARLTFVAHKNYQKAKRLAQDASGRALLLEGLNQVIAGADALISATSSPHYILKRGLFDNLLASRKYPLYIYDLAAPRDVQPEVAKIDGVFLQNLDDLNHIFSRYNQFRQERIDLASVFVEEALGLYQEVSHDKNC